MVFPAAMQSFAHFLPTFHLSEIALAMSGAPGERDVTYHIVAIVIMTVVLAGVTALAWTKQRNQ